MTAYTKGFTLVEIMIVVLLIAVLVAIAIPSFIRARCSADESIAQAHLKTICSAMEAYASANNGLYPDYEDSLINCTPPYLARSYNGQVVSGYRYSMGFSEHYKIDAAPEVRNFTGVNSFVMYRGCLLEVVSPQ